MGAGAPWEPAVDYRDVVRSSTQRIGCREPHDAGADDCDVAHRCA